ncbi:MAG: hypothetical protein PHW73_01790 [Atribacterota bacterium]|nr:hypothetical protein [Atribacterota bacterium]
MNNFTKEYIREADCKEIQGLRPKYFRGDAVYFRGDSTWKPSVEFVGALWTAWNNGDENSFWLPSGDQLDEEIVKICDKLKAYYVMQYSFREDEWLWTATVNQEHKSTIIGHDNNPLIAKIKLLKKLLKEKK